MKKRNKPKFAFKKVSVAGPRVLALFHDHNRWQYVVAWIERVQHEEGSPLLPTFLHLLYNSEAGRVNYEVRPASEGQYLETTTVRASASDWMEYLRGRLVTHGGNASAYEVLGVARPEREGVAAPPELSSDLEELYKRAASVMGLTVAELKTRYSKLNAGLQAMNLRNRLRHKGANV